VRSTFYLDLRLSTRPQLSRYGTCAKPPHDAGGVIGDDYYGYRNS